MEEKEEGRMAQAVEEEEEGREAPAVEEEEKGREEAPAADEGAVGCPCSRRRASGRTGRDAPGAW